MKIQKNKITVPFEILDSREMQLEQLKKYPYFVRERLNVVRSEPKAELSEEIKMHDKPYSKIIKRISTLVPGAILKPIRAIKPAILRKSSLMHSYYAVNSVDGRAIHVAVRISLFDMIIHEIWKKAASIYMVITFQYRNGKQV